MYLLKNMLKVCCVFTDEQTLIQEIIVDKISLETSGTIQITGGFFVSQPFIVTEMDFIVGCLPHRNTLTKEGVDPAKKFCLSGRIFMDVHRTRKFCRKSN